MPEPTERPKVDRATVNFIAGLSGVDWRVVADVLSGGHQRTEQRKRVLATLDVLGYARPVAKDESAP